jgi:excisionase family DNA binding protein
MLPDCEFFTGDKATHAPSGAFLDALHRVIQIVATGINRDGSMTPDLRRGLLAFLNVDPCDIVRSTPGTEGTREAIATAIGLPTNCAWGAENVPQPVEFYTINELAELTGRSTRTIQRAIKDGKLETEKDGKHWITADSAYKYYRLHRRTNYRAQ